MTMTQRRIDIVVRLRSLTPDYVECRQAAAEIERLSEENERLKTKLRELGHDER